jgi:septal ring factor EnvC (AmiA/AmiB activator)
MRGVLCVPVPLTTLLATLLAVFVLAACEGQPTASRDAEVQALRERVERLERESEKERARLAQDVNALRESLDEANRQLAAQEGGGQAGPAPASKAGKSPRAALRDSFNQAVEASRQALERLNQSLDESLARSKAREPGPEPAK